MASRRPHDAGVTDRDEGMGHADAALAAILRDPMICGDQFAVTMYDEDWVILADAIIGRLEEAGFVVTKAADSERLDAYETALRIIANDSLFGDPVRLAQEVLDRWQVGGVRP